MRFSQQINHNIMHYNEKCDFFLAKYQNNTVNWHSVEFGVGQEILGDKQFSDVKKYE